MILGLSPAVLSLLALLLVIGASLTSRINVGVLAVALAWPIALFAAGWTTAFASTGSSVRMTLLAAAALGLDFPLVDLSTSGAQK